MASRELKSEVAASKSNRTPLKHAEMLVLMNGDLNAAQILAKRKAEKLGIEDKNEIKKMIDDEKSAAAELSNRFKIQLAATVDCAYTLIHATYALEGDGVTVFFAWELWTMARESIRTSATEPSVVPSSGLLLKHLEVWQLHLPLVIDIFGPAWVYMQKQEEKHAETLTFLKIINGLCPWNANQMTEASLDYLVERKLLSESEKHLIIRDELDRYIVYAGLWINRPSSEEYLKRQSPATLLPEARIWRFWYVYQRVLRGLCLLVKKIAAAQVHSAAAERTGSLFTHDETVQTESTAVQTASIRMRAHYQAVVNPMRVMPLGDLNILDLDILPAQ